MKLTIKFVLALLFISIGGCLEMNAQDWANLNRFQKENNMYVEDGIDNNAIVFFGNSITQEWPTLSPDFFPGKPYTNRGISGQTTSQMLVRFRQDVIDLKPNAVIILAGTNDIAGNSGPATNEMIIGNIRSMSEIAKANNIQVLLCSILPVYDYPWMPGLNPSQRIIDINKGIKEITEELDLIYVDYFSEMVDLNNGLNKIYTYDGVHPDANGYSVMEKIIKDIIAQLN